jgi:hypothetical protein
LSQAGEIDALPQACCQRLVIGAVVQLDGEGPVAVVRPDVEVARGVRHVDDVGHAVTVVGLDEASSCCQELPATRSTVVDVVVAVPSVPSPSESAMSIERVVVGLPA